MLRISHYVDSRHTDGCEVVSLTSRPHITNRNIPGTHFCYAMIIYIYIYIYIYCHVYQVCGSMTNNSTWVRIGYRIYSLWRFTAAHITITMNTIAFLAPWIPLTELYCPDVSLRGLRLLRRLTDDDSLTH
jgi:hypothetical protein